MTAGDDLDTTPWLLWSNRWGSWWAPGRNGYTSDVWQAGRYTRAMADAEARVDSRENPPPIVAVLAPEAGVDSFTAADLAGVTQQMRHRIAEATRAVIESRQVAA